MTLPSEVLEHLTRIDCADPLQPRCEYCGSPLEQKSPAKTTAIAFTGLTVRRWNAHPGSGMVADDLGRWVSFEEHNEQLLRLERQLNALAVLLAQQQGRSVTYWRDFARREAEKC